MVALFRSTKALAYWSKNFQNLFGIFFNTHIFRITLLWSYDFLTSNKHCIYKKNKTWHFRLAQTLFKSNNQINLYPSWLITKEIDKKVGQKSPSSFQRTCTRNCHKTLSTSFAYSPHSIFTQVEELRKLKNKAFF